jgi:calcineurin-like phosphoesterase family protein
MTKVYLVGDTHYDHMGVRKYRPQFESVEDHNETIHSKVMSVSSKRNILWLLGDNFFTMESTKYLEEYSKHFLQVNWIIGNHDTDTVNRQEIVRSILKRDLIHKVGSLFTHNGFWLSHHPIHPAELFGKFNIHGHVHNSTVPDKRYMNLSWDNLVDGMPADLQKLRTRPESQLISYGEFE